MYIQCVKRKINRPCIDFYVRVGMYFYLCIKALL